MLSSEPLPTLKNTLDSISAQIVKACDTPNAPMQFIVYVRHEKAYKRCGIDRFDTHEIEITHSDKVRPLDKHRENITATAKRITVTFNQPVYAEAGTTAHAQIVASDNILAAARIASDSPIYIMDTSDSVPFASLLAKQTFLCFGTLLPSTENEAPFKVTLQSVVHGDPSSTGFELKSRTDGAMFLLCYVQLLHMWYLPEKLVHVCSLCNLQRRAAYMAESWYTQREDGDRTTAYRSGVCGDCKRDLLLAQIHKLRALPSLAEAAARAGVVLSSGTTTPPPLSPNNTKHIAKRQRTDDDDEDDNPVGVK